MPAPPWSATRARTFLECRRKYHFRYHLAPLGRRPDAPEAARRAFRVKDLVGLEAWAGDVVHGAIRTALDRWRAGRRFEEAEALELAGRLLSRQYRDSHAYWTAPGEEFPHRPVLLDLHYYTGEGPLNRDRARALKARVEGCVREFMRSELARRIRWAGPSQWLPIDRNAAARIGENLLVLVRPDFAFVEGGLLYIVDWKSGKPDPFWERVQVTCYALYAREKWRRELPDIVPQIVHLHPEFEIADVEYTPESVGEVSAFIRESQEGILSLLEDGELPPPERFPPAEDDRLCRWCQFRGICDRGSRAGH
jgi:CRISPR/Cas system-associated exonuclease Cas4 (RecB family)